MSLTFHPTGEGQHVYPFSGSPTDYPVWLNGAASPVYGMCAVNALGMPYMLGQAAVILSHDPTTGDDIRVSVEATGEYRWQPKTAVVFVGIAGEAGCIAEMCCPVINFFGSSEHAESYLSQRENVQGVVLSVPQAVEAGRIIFGSVLASQPL